MSIQTERKRFRLMGCIRYKMFNKKKRFMAYALMGCSFFIPDLSIGFMLGCALLGLNVRLIAKDRIKWAWDGIRLRW